MGERLHALLRRQLKRCVGITGTAPDAWQPLIDAVNDAYLQGDVDRLMLERSLELSSLELSEANAQLRQTVLDLRAAHHDMEVRVVERTRDLEAAHARLRQSQKMEAVGRLAGGIAHDFNNLLTTMLGYSELVLERVAADPELASDVLEIKKACERASRLTHQLLAFGRKQVLQPEVLDLNQLVVELEQMLSRVIGEDVRVELATDPDLGRARADRGQVEQLLMNLISNARDAMPTGGILRITTANAYLDEAFTRGYEGTTAGRYVSVAVEDTGCGMAADVVAQMFEPFFTTKSAGKGTGLGLATVYGIVKQSGGYITTESRPGVGTVITTYFPAVDDPLEPTAVVDPLRSLRGSEVILLVEDEASVRSITRKMLGPSGYTILEAGSGEEALGLAACHPGVIHLLLTDVVMPGMNGPTLARQLLPLRPGMKVLYVSGFPRESNVDSSSLHPGESFLAKPFTASALAGAVRTALDGGLSG